MISGFFSDFLNTSYLAGFLTLVIIYSVFAIGLNVHWGYTGIFNFGVAGFFAVGAYTSAILTKQPATGNYMTYIGGYHLPYVVGLLGAGVACAILAFIIGIPTLRLREDYLAIASIGVAETLRRVFINEMGLVNGTRGIIGIPQPLHGIVDQADYKYVYLAIVAIILVIVYVAVERGIRSPWGRVLRAIREDETTAQASGKDIFAFKMQAFVLGAFIMGIGGGMYAHYVRAITPDTFVPMFGTFLIWVMLIVGGSGNNKGAILGALALASILREEGIAEKRKANIQGTLAGISKSKPLLSFPIPGGRAVSGPTLARFPISLAQPKDMGELRARRSFLL